MKMDFQRFWSQQHGSWGKNSEIFLHLNVSYGQNNENPQGSLRTVNSK